MIQSSPKIGSYHNLPFFICISSVIFKTVSIFHRPANKINHRQNITCDLLLINMEMKYVRFNAGPISCFKMISLKFSLFFFSCDGHEDPIRKGSTKKKKKKKKKRGKKKMEIENYNKNLLHWHRNPEKPKACKERL